MQNIGKYRNFLPKYRLFIGKKKFKNLKDTIFTDFDFVNSQQSYFTVQNADILFIGNIGGFLEI